MKEKNIGKENMRKLCYLNAINWEILIKNFPQ